MDACEVQFELSSFCSTFNKGNYKIPDDSQ